MKRYILRNMARLTTKARFVGHPKQSEPIVMTYATCAYKVEGKTRLFTALVPKGSDLLGQLSTKLHRAYDSMWLIGG